jgi:hypothetical protein
MRNKPVKPVRKTLKHGESLWRGRYSLSELLEKANAYNASYDFCFLEFDEGSYGDGPSMSMEINCSESDDNFQRRMDEYHKNLENYNEWAKKNATEIAKREEEDRLKEEQKRQNAIVETEKQRLAQIKKLENELKKLKDENV